MLLLTCSCAVGKMSTISDFSRCRDSKSKLLTVSGGGVHITVRILAYQLVFVWKSGMVIQRGRERRRNVIGK